MSVSQLDNVLEQLNLKYEDLNYAEREYYNKTVFNAKNLTLPDLRKYIVEMKDAIAMQLSDTLDDKEHFNANMVLKARLKNYLLLEAFLSIPEKAEEALKRSAEAKA